jgi:hypothetical protein
VAPVIVAVGAARERTCRERRQAEEAVPQHVSADDTTKSASLTIPRHGDV